MSNYLKWDFRSETDRLLFRAINGGFQAENEENSGSIRARKFLIYQRISYTSTIEKTTNRQNALYQLVVVMVAEGMGFEPIQAVFPTAMISQELIWRAIRIQIAAPDNANVLRSQGSSALCVEENQPADLDNANVVRS